MTEAAVRKPRRIFMWVVLAVQALFVWWIVAALQGADCAGDAACQTGTGIGVFLVVGLWFGVNIFMLAGYALFKLARRP